MKKIIFLTLMLAIVTGCMMTISKISEIEIIDSQNGERNLIAKDSSTAQQIISAIKNKNKNNDDVSSLYSYKLNIRKNAETESFVMYIDVKNKAIYLSKDEDLFKVKKSISDSLLLNDSISAAYVSDAINKINISINSIIVVPSVQYDWSYKKADGSDGVKIGTLNEGGEKTVIKNDDKIDIKFDVAPDSQSAKVYQNGEVIKTSNSIKEAIESIQYDGEYLIESQLNWNKKNGTDSYGSQTLSFMADVDRIADFSVITKENYPGNIMVLQVNNLNEDETVTIKTDVVKEEPEIHPYNYKYVSILPIDLYVKPGDYNVSAIFNQGKSNEFTVAKKVNIKKKAFKTQYLTVSEELNNTNNDDKSIQEFIKIVKPARTVSSPKKLWDGEFLMPVDGRLTTDFAEIRYVNNQISSSRHSGIDLAAPKGTEVKSPNHGKVVLAADNLLSTGNTLVIDHGMGLFTSYYHLDTIAVKEGDLVKKGDIIGTVGTTGFSTGPHLHYAVSIYNTYVNTYQTLSGIFN